MSYSFVIIDLKNECNIEEINYYISSNYKDYEILYCNTRLVENRKDLFCYKFNEEAKSEEVINSILCVTKKQNIILIRKFTNFDVIKQLTDNLKEKNAVVYFTKKQNNVVKLFDNACNKICSLVFGKKIKNINHFAVAYGEVISNVIRTLNCSSNSIRMNNWTGVDEHYLESDVKYKIGYKKRRIAYSLVPLFVSILSTVLWFLLKTKFGMWYNLLTAFIVLLGFIFFFVFTNVWYYRSKVGENIIEKAKYKLN